MERRDFVKYGIVTTASAASFWGVQLLNPQTAAAAETAAQARPSLEAALARCLQTGNACLGHCITELGQGHQEMGECNKTVQEMLATCEALLKLSSIKSEHAKAQMKITAQACDNCAEACKKHSAHWGHGMHLACKECFDACLECAKLCKVA